MQDIPPYNSFIKVQKISSGFRFRCVTPRLFDHTLQNFPKKPLQKQHN